MPIPICAGSGGVLFQSDADNGSSRSMTRAVVPRVPTVLASSSVSVPPTVCGDSATETACYICGDKDSQASNEMLLCDGCGYVRMDHGGQNQLLGKKVNRVFNIFYLRRTMLCLYFKFQFRKIFVSAAPNLKLCSFDECTSSVAAPCYWCWCRDAPRGSRTLESAGAAWLLQTWG